MPGLLTIGLVCLIRFGGFLQTQEWMALDTFSRRCPMRSDLGHITIVSVDEQDYQMTGFPLSAETLAQALTNIQMYAPRVIGLDIFRELPQEEGENMLRKILASTPNIVAAEVALDDTPMMNVDAPDGIHPSQVGFADVVIDADGKLRRVVIAAKDRIGRAKASLSLRLAQQYLKKDDLDVSPALLPLFYANSGGYVRADVKNDQMLMNFCRLKEPYETVPLRDVLKGELSAEKLRDRIVLIGKTVPQARDSFVTSAVSQTLYSQASTSQPYPTKVIYGVEVHSHATEQIIGAVLGQNLSLTTWHETGEYLWILAWGGLGMAISVVLRSPWRSVLTLLLTTGLLMAISYGLLTQSLWTPIVPAALALCSAGLITAFFDRDMRFELAQRKATIERAYEAIHSGPLQKIADISRQLGSHRTVSRPQLQTQLQQLNNDVRAIFETLRRHNIARECRLHLSEQIFLDLQEPLGDLLYRVYEYTIAQPLPGFEQVQIFVSPVFEKIEDSRRYSIEEKRGLCLFLQEALLNIGKHAIGATRLDVVFTSTPGYYRLQIVDDGIGPDSPYSQLLGTHAGGRQGTYQARAIARQLGGTFQRESKPKNNNYKPQLQPGTVCELTWPK